MILRPPDYESGATNQLSYGTVVFVSFERLPRWTSIIQILTTERPKSQNASKNFFFAEAVFLRTALQRYEIFFEFQLANLDLDLNTTWEFKLHEGINGLLGRLVDVEKAAV